MSSNHLTLYLEGVFQLAKTLSIKSEYSAQQINRSVTRKGGAQSVDSSRPETWKYYLNISGEYHSTDQVMEVISLDTLQMIPFTKANLVTNPATRDLYAYGTRYYKELLLRFPDQEMLILGILYPADIQTAIAAPDFSIISYDPSLVEFNEEDLIKGIEQFTMNFARRWRVDGFNITHNLYDTSFNNILYQMLPSVIMDQRDRACNTPQAHSFHVRMHLASHQGLDEFLPYLTHEQTMWLYRNIAYVESNAGKTEIFNKLIANILTRRGIPLRGFDLVHDVSPLYDDKVKPGVAFEAVGLNQFTTSGGMVDPVSMQFKISNKAVGNPEFDLQHPDELTDKGYSLANRYDTKVLESSTLQVSDGASVVTVEQALSLWVMASATNRFNVYIRINHPITGNEMTMNAADAYYVFLYAYSKAHSSGLELIPSLYASQAPVWPRPTVAQLESLVITDVLPPNYAFMMREASPNQRTFVNLRQFQDTLDECVESLMKLQLYVAWPGTFNSKASALLIREALWSEFSYDKPETGTPIVPYLNSRDIDLGALDEQHWQDLYMKVFSSITGLNIESTATQSNIQRAMVSIMERLSSYTLMYLAPKSASSIVTIGWSNLLVEEGDQTSRLYYDIPIVDLDAYLVKEEDNLTFDIPVPNLVLDGYETYNPPAVDILGTFFIKAAFEDSEMDFNVPIGWIGPYPVNDEGVEDITFIPGHKETMQNLLPFSQVPNGNNWECTPRLPEPPPQDPNDWITITKLPILKPILVANPILKDLVAFSAPSRLRYFGDDNEVIVLNGIWSSYGNDEFNVFNYSGGITTLGLFRYTQWFDGLVLKDWKASIGNLTVDPFNIVDGSPFVFVMDPWKVMSFRQQFSFILNNRPTTIELGLEGAAGAYEWKFQQTNVDLEFSLKAYVSYVTMPFFTSQQYTSVFALAHYNEPIVLDPMRTYSAPIVLAPLTPSVGTYEMVSFEQSKLAVWDAGKLLHYNTQELTGIVPVTQGVTTINAPDDGFKLDGVAGVVQGDSFKFDMGTMILDLGDMDDHVDRPVTP